MASAILKPSNFEEPVPNRAHPNQQIRETFCYQRQSFLPCPSSLKVHSEGPTAAGNDVALQKPWLQSSLQTTFTTQHVYT